MAHIKATATTKGNRDSIAKRLGVKVFAGEKVQPGSIIIRQKGTKFNPGDGTRMGNDYTIYAVKVGIVEFAQSHDNKFVHVR